jgi:hypothetical protein
MKALKGFNTYQIKIIALILMTIDHAAVYLGALPVVGQMGELFRLLGRSSAPLFLFIVVEGLRHTRSKEKYARRLYVASLIMAAGNLLVSFVPSATAAPKDNIFSTFFYVALYVILCEKMIQAIQAKKPGKMILPGLLFAATCGFAWLQMLIYNAPFSSAAAWKLVVSGADALFPNPFTVEYSFIFIALGVAWYFLRGKKLKCGLFALLCVFSYLFNYKIPNVSFYFRFYDLFTNQFWMFLALPFMALYNDKKGGSMKYFFYAYYPLNIYILYFIGAWIAARSA